MTNRTLTLRRAIVLTVALSLLIPALLINGYSWLTQYNADIRKQTQELLNQNADVLANGMQEPLWNISRESGSALINAMMTGNDTIVRIDVLDNKLGVFVSKERPERRVGATMSTKRTVAYMGKTIGSINIEISSDRQKKAKIAGLVEQIIALTWQVVLSIALILILLESRLIRPLQQLGKGAQRLTDQQLDVPFTWKRLDEIGLLSQRLEATRISLRKLFSTLLNDIEQRKLIVQKLYEREERYRVLFERSPVAIIEWDSNHHVVEWNNAAERTFGYTRENAIGQHVNMIVQEAFRESVNETMDELLIGIGISRKIFQNIGADGKIIYCQWNSTRIDNREGSSGHLLTMAEDITEKRRSEEALSLSEAKFSSAFQSNPDPITIARVGDGVLFDVNEQFTIMTGYFRNEVVGKTLPDLDFWVNHAERDRLEIELRLNNIVRDFEMTARTKYGEIRTCVNNCTTFSIDNEKYVMTVVRDVTEQRLLEEQKAQADHALLRLAQGTRDMTGESFFESLVTDLASALHTDRAFIGLRVPKAPDQIRTIAAFAHGKLIDNFEFPIQGAPSATVLSGEIVVCPDGIQARFPDVRYLIENEMRSYAGAPLHDIEGNIIGVLSVLHSQPMRNSALVKSLLPVFSERASSELERKRAGEALRISEHRLSTMFQSSPVAMFVTQLSGRYLIKDINHAFEQLFLRSRETVIDKDTFEISLYCNDADRNIEMENLNRIGHTPEIWMNRGNGSKMLVQLSGHTFVLAGEKFGIVACQDVTDKRRIENEVRELNATLEERVIERTNELKLANRELSNTLQTLSMAQEELVRSEKMAALGALVAGIAHELNTPIGNSLMVASTLADQTSDLKKTYANGNGIKRSMLENFIADISNAGDILVRNLFRAANLVTSFKQVAMDQTSSQRRRFSLSEVVSEIILTLSPSLKKTSIIVSQNIPDNLMLDSYPGPLGQVITNLLNNTLLHAFDGHTGGKIEIKAVQITENWLELLVTDDGVGIPPTNLNRIFDPFFTTKLGSGGSGLGLHITHNIVTDVLGGQINVQSEIGIGSTFIISLPTVAPQKQAEELSN